MQKKQDQSFLASAGRNKSAEEDESENEADVTQTIEAKQKKSVKIEDIAFEQKEQKKENLDFDQYSQTDNFGQTESDRMDTMQDDIMSAREKQGTNKKDMDDKMKYMQNTGGKGVTAIMGKASAVKNASQVTIQ